MTDMLIANNVSKVFGGGRTWLGKTKPKVHAVQNISLTVKEGETLGIVGESGCGKSTLAQVLVGLLTPSQGEVIINGNKLETLRKDPTELSRTIQYIFQDPISSLNPRKTILETLEAPLKHLYKMDKQQRLARIHELLDAVNIRPEFLSRYPHEFSGGQAQRISIARALAANPKIIILEEPVSALDVSVQAQVLNLLEELKQRFNLTYIFISHDLGVVEAICDRVAVLYFGSMVESGKADSIFSHASHPYTDLLASSAPVVGKASLYEQVTNVELPDPLDPPPGCPFSARCNYAIDQCLQSKPTLSKLQGDHETACHNPRIQRSTPQAC